MVSLLDLPMELLLLIIRELEYNDTLRFCNANKLLRAAFRPDFLCMIVEFKPCSQRDYAIDNISYDLLCHALCELYRKPAPIKDMEALIQRRGASFGYLPNSELIFDALVHQGYLGKLAYDLNEITTPTFNREARNRIDFLFCNGGSPTNVPGGIDELLCEFVNYYPYTHVEAIRTLLDYGASLLQMPAIHDHLVEVLMDTKRITDYIVLLNARGADVRKSTEGLTSVLERYFLRHGLCMGFNFLVGLGADITKTPKGIDQLLTEVILASGHCVESQYLLSVGASIDYDYMHTELANEFLLWGTSVRFSNILSCPGVSLQEVHGGIDSLLDWELRRSGLTADVGFLLGNGAQLSNVPEIESLLPTIIYEAIFEPDDMETVFAHLQNIRESHVGVSLLLQSILGIVKEEGNCERLHAILASLMPSSWWEKHLPAEKDA